jgi:hypothetical protein
MVEYLAGNRIRGLSSERLVPEGFATGGDTIGTYTESGTAYKYHEFSTTGSSANFVITSGITSVEYLIVAGGGGGGDGGPGSSYGVHSAGGGAGGLLNGTSSVSAGTYNIVVGASVGSDTQGNNSSFNSLTALGGGKGATNYSGGATSGGSGGGGSGTNTGTSGQGNAGYGSISGGGGGGKGSASTSSAGGSGFVSTISGGTSTTYSEGGSGGGATQKTTKGSGGRGGIGQQVGPLGGLEGIVVLRYISNSNLLPNVQDGAVYYETDNNKEYVLYNNTWTEL